MRPHLTGTLRILLLDWNAAYSGICREWLETHVRNCQVDRAGNLPVLRARLRDNEYDFILADTSTESDRIEMESLLRHSQATVIYWSFNNGGGINKPLPRDLPSVLEKMLVE